MANHILNTFKAPQGFGLNTGTGFGHMGCASTLYLDPVAGSQPLMHILNTFKAPHDLAPNSVSQFRVHTPDPTPHI